MAGVDYVKKSDAELVIQLNNFAVRLPIHASVLGVTTGEQTAAVDDAAMFQFYINLVARSEDYKKLLVANKDILKDGAAGSTAPPSLDIFDPGVPPTAVLPGILVRFRRLAKKIKASAAYSQSIGESLGILAPIRAVDPNPKPLLSGRTLPNYHVRLRVTKGIYSGIYIEMRRGTGTWEFLDRSLASSYTDISAPVTPGGPEERHYRARFLVGNQAVGQWSDEVKQVANS